jgi:hypothetical protein
MLFHSYQGMLDFLWCVRTTSTTSYPLVKLVYSRCIKNKKDTLTKRLMTAWKMRHCRIWSSRGQTSGNFNLLDTFPRHALTTRPFQKNSFRLEYSVLTTLNWLRRALGKLVLLITGPHLWCCTDYFFVFAAAYVWCLHRASLAVLRWLAYTVVKCYVVLLFACLCWTSFRSSITSGSFPVGVLGFSDWRSTTWHVIWVLGILCTSFLNCGAV